ncbi:PcfJ-like protein [Spirosomataceae bacterium]
MKCNSDDIKQTINDTRELVNNCDLFEQVTKNFYDSVEHINQLRLTKWLIFFNKNYFKSPCIFSNSVYALFEATEKNELFKTQTEHEFEISIKFYEKIWNSKFFISIENIENASQLLNISLVLGKYPGMQIRSVYRAMELLINGTNEYSLNKVFEYIFVKFENPIILTHNLNNLNLIEIDVLMFVLQGNNIRNHPEIPLPISKKESYIIVNKAPYLKFTDNVVKRSVATSKLIKASNNTEFLQGFFMYNRIFEYKINTFINDIDFWCDAYSFLLKVDWDSTHLNIQEFMDYFDYMKYYSDIEFSLKGRSINSIANAIDNWHEAAHFARQKELINLSWKGNATNEHKIHFEEEKYLFKEIINGEELYRESDEMKHCVFSYIESCYHNYCAIWSMKKEENTTFKHHLTIEVRNKNIVQIAGKRNQKPTRKDETIIREWANEMEFTLSDRIY